MRLLKAGEFSVALVWLATLLLDGDTAAAAAIVRDSLAAVQHAWTSPADPGTARMHLCRAVLSRTRSVRRHQAPDDCNTPPVAADAPDARTAAAGYLDREPWASALRALPLRQREAIALREYMGLSDVQTAQVMCIAIGAARSHLARGMSALPTPTWPAPRCCTTPSRTTRPAWLPAAPGRVPWPCWPGSSVTTPPPWSPRSPTPAGSPAATSTSSTASTSWPAWPPAHGARVIKASDFTDNAVGIIHLTGPKLAKLAAKYAPLVPALRELILRPDTPLDADVKDMIVA